MLELRHGQHSSISSSRWSQAGSVIVSSLHQCPRSVDCSHITGKCHSPGPTPQRWLYIARSFRPWQDTARVVALDAARVKDGRKKSRSIQLSLQIFARRCKDKKLSLRKTTKMCRPDRSVSAQYQGPPSELDVLGQFRVSTLDPVSMSTVESKSRVMYNFLSNLQAWNLPVLPPV